MHYANENTQHSTFFENLLNFVSLAGTPLMSVFARIKHGVNHLNNGGCLDMSISPVYADTRSIVATVQMQNGEKFSVVIRKD